MRKSIVMKSITNIAFLIMILGATPYGCGKNSQDPVLLDPPSGVTVTAENSNIIVSWNPVSGAKSYNIYWAATAGVNTSTGTKVNVSTSPYIQTELTYGTTYYYVITTVNDTGESLPSGQASAMLQVPVPGTPSGVSAAGGNAQVTVNWSPVSGASSYNVYWSTSAGAQGTKINAVQGASYTHAGLTNGVVYYYVVTAVNAGGESPASTQVSAMPQVPAPGTPSGVSASGGNAQATVNWNTVSTASSYNLYWSTSSGVTTTSGTRVTGVTSPYLYTGLTNGATYYFIVTAVNAGGESPASTQVGAMPQVPAPDAPNGISAVGGDAQVTVSWNPVSGADSYNIYYSTSPGVLPSNGTKISGASSPYTLSGLTYGSTYYFIVTAVNSGGESAASSEVGIVMQLPAPKNPAAIPGANKVTLSWEGVPGAATYNIYYSTSPNVTTTDQKITGIASTTYVHAGLTPLTAYYYRISSVKDLLESPLSTEVTSSPLLATTIGVTAGTGHTVLLKADGTVWTIGLNLYGQYGNGTFTTTTTLTSANTLGDVKTISAGAYHTLALKQDGTVWGWGSNSVGQVGNGSFADVNTPTQVLLLSDTTAISAGSFHSAALLSDGTVMTWGDDEYGQLGDGATSAKTRPVQVAGLSGVKAIATGSLHTIAVKDDGTVWAWGYNGYGELGNGTTVNSSSPVQVSGLTGVLAISAGYAHNIALRTDGTVWAWGSNSYGQLGDGTANDQLIPVQVSGLSAVIAVDANLYNSIALKSDGTVWTWGLNANGQLGNGTYVDSNIPVEISTLSGIVAVSEGTYHAAALKNDGTVWTWGSNINGQLGNAAINSQPLPAQEPALGDQIASDFIPPAPQYVIAIPGASSQVTINWQPVVGAAYYNIYYSTSSGVTTTNGIKIPTVFPVYTQEVLPPNITNYYIVTAVSATNGESSASDEVDATPQLTPLLVPTRKTALATATTTTKDYSYYSMYDNSDPNNCLSQENISEKFKLLTTNDTGSLRQAMVELYRCSGPFFQTMPFDLEYYGKMFILATFVSHNMAPYGPDASGYLTQRATLNCDDYASLALILFESVVKQDAAYKGTSFMFGFDSSLFGNHAQLSYQSDYYSLLTDPTTGIAALTTYNDLFAGRPIQNNKIARFYSYFGNPNEPVSIEDLFDEIMNQLSIGGYSSFTILYTNYNPY